MAGLALAAAQGQLAQRATPTTARAVAVASGVASLAMTVTGSTAAGTAMLGPLYGQMAIESRDYVLEMGGGE